MRIEEIKNDDIKGMTGNYDYVLINEYSKFSFGRTEDVSLNWDQCSEAYLFNEKEQIHVFLEDNDLKAVKVTEDASDVHYLDRNYEVSGRFNSICKEVTVREYLNPDEDGQAVVTYTRLVSTK